METNPESHKAESEGEYWLKRLGFEDSIGTVVTYEKDGIQHEILAENFLDVCGDIVRPMLNTFDSLDANHPNYDRFRSALQTSLAKNLGKGQN